MTAGVIDDEAVWLWYLGSADAGTDHNVFSSWQYETWFKSCFLLLSIFTNGEIILAATAHIPGVGRLGTERAGCSRSFNDEELHFLQGSTCRGMTLSLPGRFQEDGSRMRR